MIGKITQRMERLLLRSSRYRWYIFSPRISRETIAPLLSRYPLFAAGGRYMQRGADGSLMPVPKKQLRENAALQEKCVVYHCDGTTLAGGFADRLKGILSLYAICREMDYTFRIHYTSPFRLEEYFAPAAYDWRISPEELCTDEAAMLVLENTDDAPYQTRKQAQWLRHRLKEGPRMMHVITNTNHAYDLDYATLFRELFQPTPLLQDALQAELQLFEAHHPGVNAQGYISVSARFLTMLGDFRETGGGGGLPDEQAEALIQRNLEQIQRLHEAHPGQPILVNSDSGRFLKRANALPYVYTVEGDIAHTDLMATAGAERMHLKLFLDFLLISRASHIFMLHTPPMRISGFPYAASRIGGHPFHVVEF